MKTTSEIRRENLILAKDKAGGTLELLAEKTNTNASYLSQINNQAIDPKTGNPRSMGSQIARKIEVGLYLPTGWMDVAHTQNTPTTSTPNASRAGYSIGVANDKDEFFVIPYHDAKGSCGGGYLNYEDSIKGELRKEPRWFKKYQVNPHDALCVYAHGDSMEPYIMDGDMVILDKSKTEPINGKVYLISHPDGERIKRLRRAIDGSWVLESDNPNKKMYPDESISPDQVELMKIIGMVIYRQG